MWKGSNTKENYDVDKDRIKIDSYHHVPGTDSKTFSLRPSHRLPSYINHHFLFPLHHFLLLLAYRRSFSMFRLKEAYL